MNQRDFISEHQCDYPEGFFRWLQHNRHIWIEFEKKALQMARIRERYSARTIIEVLRWNTDLRQSPNLFKISNNMTPGLARLWMSKHGVTYPIFFSLHKR